MRHRQRHGLSLPPALKLDLVSTEVWDSRVKRRLAAILAADVAGYSRLIGNDEEGTLAALKACREN
jgi:class 3 adenylate cyclase